MALSKKGKIVKKNSPKRVKMRQAVEEEPVEEEYSDEEIETTSAEEPEEDVPSEDDDFAFEEGAEETEFEHPEKQQKKTGVLYFSSIPPKFTPTRLQDYFEQRAPGMVGRVFLEKNKRSKSATNRYSEGWLEIKRKKLAKRLAEAIDNTPVGGKKSDPTSSALWNIKYLSGFKWVHLVEQLEYEKTAHNRRMTAEVSQARRIAAHFEEQVEKGENLRKLEKKVLKQGGNWEKFQRQITQKQVLKTKKARKEKTKEDDLMKMIFAE